MEKKIVKLFLKSGLICEGEKSIYEFGLKLLISRIIHSLIILIIGLVGGEFLSMLFFLITYVTIREYSGGYHAKSKVGCYVCTTAVTFSVLILLKIIAYAKFYWVLLVLMICGSIIWILSPREAKNKPLDTLEKLVYRKKTKRLLVLFGSIVILGIYHVSSLKGIVCAWFIQALMLFIGMPGK